MNEQTPVAAEFKTFAGLMQLALEATEEAEVALQGREQENEHLARAFPSWFGAKAPNPQEALKHIEEAMSALNEASHLAATAFEAGMQTLRDAEYALNPPQQIVSGLCGKPIGPDAEEALWSLRAAIAEYKKLL